MNRHHALLGLVTVALLNPSSLRADVRNLNWVQEVSSAALVCLGRVVSVTAIDSDAGRPALSASVLLSQAVRGNCPKQFTVRASDSWEVLDAPDQLRREYLFFVTNPGGPAGSNPTFEVPSRLAWQRERGETCDGKPLNYYHPHYVNLPSDLKLRLCVKQYLPLGSPPIKDYFQLVPEDLLFSRLASPLPEASPHS